MFKQTRSKFILFMVVLLGGTAMNMLARQQVLHSEKKVDLPPNTVEGTLANGLHYLILPNEAPVHTTEFRLVMRIGPYRSRKSKKGPPIFWSICRLPVVNIFPAGEWLIIWRLWV